MSEPDPATTAASSASAPAESKRKRESVSSTEGGDTGYVSEDENYDDKSDDDSATASDAEAETKNEKGKKTTPKKKTMKKNQTKQTKFSKLGRRGDPRMHKAVIGRLQNSELSLLDALKFGGFIFPALDTVIETGDENSDDKDKAEDGSVVNTENVTLAQRKNQLSRRLRIARMKGTGADDVAAQYAKECGIDINSIPVPVPSRRGGRKRSKKRSKKSKATDEDATTAAALQGNAMGIGLGGNVLNGLGMPMFDPNNPPLLPGAPVAIAGLPDSAPEVIIEDADADPTATGSGKAAGARKAKDHPMFAQYQASLLNNPAHWGGLHNVMASVAANQAMAANAGLAALGAAAGAHSHAAALQQAGLGMGLGNLPVSQMNATASPAVSALSAVAAAASSSNNAATSASTSSAGGAPDSLAVAAATLGISREQLASMMGQDGSAKKGGEEKKDAVSGGDEENRSTSDGAIPPVHDESAMDETKLNIALGVYQPEHSTLIKRCLLIAGCEPSKTEECDPLYLTFCERAAEAERKRLHRLGACFQGRHVHRLEGKCGHKAVVHHPPGDDKPHIDFIVDGKIECYKGIPGLKSGDNEAMWPSKFTCQNISCPTGRSDTGEGEHFEHGEVTCGKGTCEKKCAEAVKHIKPAILDMKELENDSEWNFITDGNLIDDSLLGLTSLAEDYKAPEMV